MSILLGHLQMVRKLERWHRGGWGEGGGVGGGMAVAYDEVIDSGNAVI